MRRPVERSSEEGRPSGRRPDDRYGDRRGPSGRRPGGRGPTDHRASGWKSGEQGRGRPGPSRPRGGGRGERPRQQRLSPKERRQQREGFGRLYIDKQIREKMPMVLVLYDQSLEAILQKRLCYDLDVLVNGEKTRVNKLPIKYMYKKKDEASVQKALTYNEEVRKLNLQPVKPRTERFQIDTRQLAFARQQNIPIRVTLRGGEVFTGLIDWYSYFEIKMNLGDDGSVVIFRHAAHEFELVGTPPPSDMRPRRQTRR